MSIFSKALQYYISKALDTAATLQTQKKASYVPYNKQLSEDQFDIIDELRGKIRNFESNEKDNVISTKIIALIDLYYEKIRTVRGKHDANKDKGETIDMLRKLMSLVPEFYTKLDAFDFTLLNMPYFEMPEVIVYYHASLYLAEEIFYPQSKKTKDSAVRSEKEERLCARLKLLSQLIKPEYTFDERKKWTAEVLIDLNGDNEKIIAKANAKHYFSIPLLPISGPSFLNMKVSLAELLGCRLGRFSEHFNKAVREIDRVSEELEENKEEYESDTTMKI